MKTKYKQHSPWIQLLYCVCHKPHLLWQLLYFVCNKPHWTCLFAEHSMCRRDESFCNVIKTECPTIIEPTAFRSAGWSHHPFWLTQNTRWLPRPQSVVQLCTPRVEMILEHLHLQSAKWPNKSSLVIASRASVTENLVSSSPLWPGLGKEYTTPCHKNWARNGKGIHNTPNNTLSSKSMKHVDVP